MSKQRDEQWLDSQLRRVIPGDTPRFDAQTWKQKHSEEYQKLLARRIGRGLPQRVRPGRWSWWGKPHPTIAELAVAAVIAVAIGFLVLHRGASKPGELAMPTASAARSASEMMSMKSLRLAYEQGGLDALDRQLQNTLDEFGPRSSSVSLQELF